MSKHDEGRAPGDVAQALAALHEELRGVRRGQQRLMKLLLQTRAELNHRLSTSREELGALIKASHAELTERIEDLDGLFDDQRQRLSGLERDLDGIFEGGRP